MAKTAAERFEESYDATLYGDLNSDAPQILVLPLEDVRPNPDQPRKHFDEGALRSLADSIEQVGQLQPGIVKEDPDEAGKYIIVSGERRWRACDLAAGIETYLATLLPPEHAGNIGLIALIENVQREDLDPFEEADGYKQLMKAHGYKQGELAKLVGKKRNTISEVLTLTKVPEEIRTEYREGDFRTRSKQVLIEIARERSKEVQAAMWKKAQKQKLTLKAIRDIKKEQETAREQASRLLLRLGNVIEQIAGKEELFPAGSTQRGDLLDISEELAKLIETTFSSNKRKK